MQQVSSRRFFLAWCTATSTKSCIGTWNPKTCFCRKSQYQDRKSKSKSLILVLVCNSNKTRKWRGSSEQLTTSHLKCFQTATTNVAIFGALGLFFTFCSVATLLSTAITTMKSWPPSSKENIPWKAQSGAKLAIKPKIWWAKWCSWTWASVWLPLRLWDIPLSITNANRLSRSRTRLRWTRPLKIWNNLKWRTKLGVKENPGSKLCLYCELYNKPIRKRTIIRGIQLIGWKWRRSIVQRGIGQW